LALVGFRSLALALADCRNPGLVPVDFRSLALALVDYHNPGLVPVGFHSPGLLAPLVLVAALLVADHHIHLASALGDYRSPDWVRRVPVAESQVADHLSLV
jgi:hypothetical protein